MNQNREGETGHHPHHGRGRVHASRHRGLDLLIEFEQGPRRWIRTEAWVPDTPPPTSPGTPENHLIGQPHDDATVVSPPTGTALQPDETYTFRRMIEAFRMGTVPDDCVEHFTFGREEETEQIADWLDETNEDILPNALLVVGRYGTGKSHLLNYAYSRALHRGFAVAKVEMDPNESPFHKPKNVYRRLVSTLQYRSPENGKIKKFRDFINEATTRGLLRDHFYFKQVAGSRGEMVWEWIEGNGAIYPGENDSNSAYFPLYDDGRSANIYCYLLSGVGHAARQMGLKGILLIYDEAETFNVISYSYQEEQALNFIRSLVYTARGDRRLMDDGRRGLDTAAMAQMGLEASRRGKAQRIPFIYSKPTGLKMLFAFTPSYELEILPELNGLPRIDLESLSRVDLEQAFTQICDLYNQAYRCENETPAVDEVFSRLSVNRVTRHFVKGAVEVMDLLRAYPGTSLDDVLA